MKIDRRAFLAAALIAGATRAGRAQAWPARQVTIVVPFAAGGPTDVVARVLAERLAPRLGRPVIVENRVGSGGDAGGIAVARATSDGHTLLLSTTGSLTVNRHLRPNAQYDPLRDLAPASLTFKSDHVVVVAKNVAARTLDELIALARRAPGSLAYGSAGVGATSHVIAELFKTKAGIEMRHVPYRGAGPALNDLVAGHIQAMVDSLANALPQIQAGTVRALAVTGKSRHPALPDVPTVREAGLAFDAFAWGALLAPRGTPDEILARLSREVREIYRDDATVRRLAQVGADAVASDPQELATFMAADSEQWGRVVREAGIKAE
jgi:tripartite-type tricarboxylate transporter receptor subunit TctC